MKNILFLFGILFLAHSCIKPIPIEVPQMKPKLAINSQIIPNQVVLVSVSKTFTSLFRTTDSGVDQSGFDFFVPHAFVTVSYAGKVDTLTHLAEGFYASVNTLLTPNSTYTLFVYDSISKESISAITTMKSLVDVPKVQPVKKIIGKDTSFTIDYTIKDNPAEENYYFVSLSRTNQIAGPIGVPSQVTNLFTKSTYLYLHTDDDAQNGLINKQIDIKSTNITASDTVMVLVANIDKEFYKYLNAFKKSGSVITQLTGEPINFPTNVNNGYGFFSAHFPNIHYFELGKY
jgi:hypothetical protein